ncbi:thermonuclease family protein [Baaleninema simplex]|uniref:thermonuclease family protein n=1 Tax=Baaleninema simplex TaxID=2862350 RepID=UPI000475C7C8|nr:thermonuclease family protein [Baaleninema simplex]
MRRLAIALLLCGLWLAGCQPQSPQETETARVVRVVSGQTVEVEFAGEVETVRLLGLDAPDLQQVPWGEAAKMALEADIGGKTVQLEFDLETRDRFDRRLGYIWLDGTLINERAIARGHGLFASRPPNVKYDTRLQHARDRARILGLGIWNPDDPLRQTPSEFRQQRR